MPLPASLKRFLVQSATWTALCVLSEFVCRFVLHWGFPYDYPAVPPTMIFGDLRFFRSKFLSSIRAPFLPTVPHSAIRRPWSLFSRSFSLPRSRSLTASCPRWGSCSSRFCSLPRCSRCCTAHSSRAALHPARQSGYVSVSTPSPFRCGLHSTKATSKSSSGSPSPSLCGVTGPPAAGLPRSSSPQQPL
jgi:hypothetical protein